MLQFTFAVVIYMHPFCLISTLQGLDDLVWVARQMLLVGGCGGWLGSWGYWTLSAAMLITYYW